MGLVKDIVLSNNLNLIKFVILNYKEPKMNDFDFVETAEETRPIVQKAKLNLRVETIVDTHIGGNIRVINEREKYRHRVIFSLTDEPLTEGVVENEWVQISTYHEATGHPPQCTRHFRVYQCPEYRVHPRQEEWDLWAEYYFTEYVAKTIYLVKHGDTPMFCIDLKTGNCQLIPKGHWAISRKDLSLQVDDWCTQCLEPMQVDPSK